MSTNPTAPKPAPRQAELQTICEQLMEIPNMVLANERLNPAWSKAEIWGIERDIIPSIRLLCMSVESRLLNLSAPVPPSPVEGITDTQRLDWLQNNPFTLYSSQDPQTPQKIDHFVCVNESKETRFGLVNPTVRQSIDAAISAALRATQTEGKK